MRKLILVKRGIFAEFLLRGRLGVSLSNILVLSIYCHEFPESQKSDFARGFSIKLKWKLLDVDHLTNGPIDSEGEFLHLRQLEKFTVEICVFF